MLIMQDTTMEKIAKARCEIEMCRLLVCQAAHNMDTLGNRDARTRQLLSMVKARVPATVGQIVDDCMQSFGAMGFSQDTPLFHAFAGARFLRMADGPDEVHWRTAARLELKLQKASKVAKIGLVPPKKGLSWRKTTDPITNPAALRTLDLIAKL